MCRSRFPFCVKEAPHWLHLNGLSPVGKSGISPGSILQSFALHGTCVAALVHHQHVGSGADHAAHLALELPVGQADGSRRGGLQAGNLAASAGLVPAAACVHGVAADLLPAVVPQTVSAARRLVVTAELNLDGVGYIGKKGECDGEPGGPE